MLVPAYGLRDQQRGRPDLCVVANVLSGSMAKPRVGGEALVKKVCRYLRWHPACAHCQSRQAVENEVKVLTDSDSGGDKTTRRSTSGLVVQMGDHVMYFATRFQKSVASRQERRSRQVQVARVSEGGVQNLVR